MAINSLNIICITCFIALIITTVSHCQEVSDLRLCADEHCKKTISFATARANYQSDDPNHLSLLSGQAIRVTSKSAGTRPDLWGGESNKQFGYFPKSYVKEYKVFTHTPEHLIVTQPVPVEPEKLSEQQEGTEDGTTESVQEKDTENEKPAVDENSGQIEKPKENDEDIKESIDETADHMKDHTDVKIQQENEASTAEKPEMVETLNMESPQTSESDETESDEAESVEEEDEEEQNPEAGEADETETDTEEDEEEDETEIKENLDSSKENKNEEEKERDQATEGKKNEKDVMTTETQATLQETEQASPDEASKDSKESSKEEEKSENDEEKNGTGFWSNWFGGGEENGKESQDRDAQEQGTAAGGTGEDSSAHHSNDRTDKPDSLQHTETNEGENSEKENRLEENSEKQKTSQEVEHGEESENTDPNIPGGRLRHIRDSFLKRRAHIAKDDTNEEVDVHGETYESVPTHIRAAQPPAPQVDHAPKKQELNSEGKSDTLQKNVLPGEKKQEFNSERKIEKLQKNTIQGEKEPLLKDINNNEKDHHTKEVKDQAIKPNKNIVNNGLDQGEKETQRVQEIHNTVKIKQDKKHDIRLGETDTVEVDGKSEKKTYETGKHEGQEQEHDTAIKDKLKSQQYVKEKVTNTNTDSGTEKSLEEAKATLDEEKENQDATEQKKTEAKDVETDVKPEETHKSDEQSLEIKPTETIVVDGTTILEFEGGPIIIPPKSSQVAKATEQIQVTPTTVLDEQLKPTIEDVHPTAVDQQTMPTDTLNSNQETPVLVDKMDHSQDIDADQAKEDQKVDIKEADEEAEEEQPEKTREKVADEKNIEQESDGPSIVNIGDSIYFQSRKPLESVDHEEHKPEEDRMEPIIERSDPDGESEIKKPEEIHEETADVIDEPVPEDDISKDTVTPTPVPDEPEEIAPNLPNPEESTRPTPVGAETPDQTVEHVGRKIPDEQAMEDSEAKQDPGLGAVDSVLQSLVHMMPASLVEILKHEPTGLSPPRALLVAIISVISLGIISSLALRGGSASNSRKQMDWMDKVKKLEEKLFIEIKQKENLEEELSQNKDKLKQFAGRSTSSAQEVHKFKQDLQTTQLHNSTLKDTVNAQQEQIVSFHDMVESLNSSVVSKESELAQTQNRLTQLEEHATAIERQMHEQRNALDASQMGEMALQDQISGLNEEISILQQSKDQLLLEAEGWNDRIFEVSNQMKEMENQEKNLREEIDFRDNELEVLRDCFKQLKAFEEKPEAQEDDNKDETDSIPSENAEGKIKAMMDVSKTEAKLKKVKEERDNYEQKYSIEVSGRKELEEQVQRLTAENQSLLAGHRKAELKSQESSTKLSVLSEYFKEKETLLQKELGEQEARRKHSAEQVATTSEQAAMFENEMASYRTQVEDLKNEISKIEKQYRTEIATQEKKAHDSWLTARDAERSLQESKKECSSLRQRLVEQDRKFEMEFERGPGGPGLLRPLPKRGLPPSAFNGPPPPGMGPSPVGPEGERPMSIESGRNIHPQSPPLLRDSPMDRGHGPPPPLGPPDRPPYLPPDRPLPPLMRRGPPPPFDRRSPPPFDRRGPPRRSPPHFDRMGAPPMRGPLPPRGPPLHGNPRRTPPYGRPPSDIPPDEHRPGTNK